MRPVRTATLALSLSLFAGTVAVAECDFRTSQYLEELSDIGSVQRIEFIANNYRKWARNGLRLVTSGGEQILERYKKKFKGRIVVHYPFGQCTYKAEVRQNGDFKDHVQFRRGRLLQSLNVKLKEGNIAGAVRFKLFLKETRNAGSEILGTMLLERLGFLAPRTRLIDVVQNGTEVEMIWQETPAKEFLEHNGRREGPIFEGDETVLSFWSQDEGYQLEDLALARLINDKWAARGHASLLMSTDAFARLQRAYADFANLLTLDPSKALTSLPLPLTENPEMREEWWTYGVALFAMRGSHALRPHNRKFYWNAFLQSFEPIYYDGEIDIARDRPRYLRDHDRTLYFGNLAPEALERLIQRHHAIDTGAFAARYVALCGAKKCAPATAKAFLADFGRNLAAYRGISGDAGTLFPETREGIFAQRFFARLPEGRIVTYTGLTRSGQNAAARVCTVSGCDDESRPTEALLKGMSGLALTDTGPELALADHPEGMGDYRITELPFWGAEIRHSPGARVVVDQAAGVLRLEQSTATDWFLVLGGHFGAVDIVFDGSDPDKGTPADAQRFNAFGLTGCLTFHESRFEATRVQAGHGGCEDSVNIVRSQGTLAELHISDANADALDVDFSDIAIARLRVERAGNDCADFSSGRYSLGQVRVESCDDKGVSVGEGSQLQIETLDGKAVNIGLSSKDSSRVQVERLEIAGAQTCYEAFQKKQEFFGGHLSLEQKRCHGAAAHVDRNSTIIEGGLTQ